MTTDEKAKYPALDNLKCPVCGSARRLAAEVLQHQIDDGKLPKESIAFITQCQSVVAGPVGTWLSAPCIISFFDVCVECGTFYCTHAEVQTVVQGGKPKNNYQAGKGFSRS